MMRDYRHGPGKPYEAAAEKNRMIAVSSISLVEIVYLEERHRIPAGTRCRVFDIVPFDDQSVAVFERFRVHRRFRKVGRADLLIASIVLAHAATLVTRNVRHFRQFPRLAVTNWVD